MTLSAHEVTWRRGGTPVLESVSLAPSPGQTVGLLGPNGSGKSSLLRLLQGLAKPDSGSVALDGEALSSFHRRDLAKRIATVTQQAETDTDITVRDVVRLGRTPHRGMFGGNRTSDQAAVDRALKHVGMDDKAERYWRALSGGERQRAHIARALAQEPRELLLDEPTNHLDIKHQLELLKLVAELPVTTIVALHDLNLAAMFCDTVLVLKDGRAVAHGTPAEVLTPELIAEVYEVSARVVEDEGTQRPRVEYVV